MGVTKKPAVIAKTAAKKRGRPVGSKNKPKKVTLSRSNVQFAKDSGIPLEKFAIATLKEEKLTNKIVADAKKVDWEKLAKQLQAALAAEMKENEALERIINDFKSVVRLDSSFTFWDRLVFLFSGKL